MTHMRAAVPFEPLEYPREEDSHAYSVTTKEELLGWVKNGDQTYRDLLVPVCVLASSPSSAFRYKSYADFFLIILDFCIAVASVWPQPSANRSLIQVGLIRPGRNVTHRGERQLDGMIDGTTKEIGKNLGGNGSLENPWVPAGTRTTGTGYARVGKRLPVPVPGKPVPATRAGFANPW
ncbi:hypothetical protein EDB85DRAFT_1893013 [Lactarius pseudohatsudake]|nr:hypothetical protein EDB85DRAFT_1893013 [Lactarius pseudohatsudake]